MATNGFVHIIESPSDTDLLNGRTEGRLLWETMQLAKIRCCYNLAVSKSTFEAALRQRLHEAHSNFNVPPILHLSMHGNERGVSLTDGTTFNWNQLRGAIKPLCDEMRGNLLICMSTCSGAYAQIMAMDETDEIPAFWAVVGSVENVSWQDSALAYATFYTHFFRGQAIEECVRRMHEASGHPFVHVDGKETHRSWVEAVARQGTDLAPGVQSAAGAASI